MGIDTTQEHQALLQFQSPADAAAFADLLRACTADDTLVAEFDRLTGSNLRLEGGPLNTAIDRSSGRTETELQRFAAFVYDVVWSRLPDKPGSACA
ncbi:hypothetical protein [Luteimonas sp. MHLX1A]|uniref:hypothetical protein n=1 Tax=Alterluteimonas muca TaxID=2878684 RepID=UPI001E29309A|nr:hypothetical protein [Luteimonas sp. MHLX1A]MCD9046877.1 hypothetical protein [Luteimonas sp. MHLX1A]